MTGDKFTSRRCTKLAESTIRFAMITALTLSGTPAIADDDDYEIPFDEARIYFELNDTDGDLGIHALIDGEPWKKLSIESPSEKTLLNVKVKGRLRKQGLTELFFESAEPGFDELEPETFFQRFPEGIYEIEGKTLDGFELETEAELSHILPAPAEGIEVSGVEFAEDCDEEVPLVAEPVIISWQAVTTSHPELGKAGPVSVRQYQLVVEREEPELLVYHVDLPAYVTSFSVPELFTALGDEFKYEILVQAENGNQTATESCFAIE